MELLFYWLDGVSFHTSISEFTGLFFPVLRLSADSVLYLRKFLCVSVVAVRTSPLSTSSGQILVLFLDFFKFVFEIVMFCLA